MDGSWQRKRFQLPISPGPASGRRRRRRHPSLAARRTAAVKPRPGEGAGGLRGRAAGPITSPREGYGHGDLGREVLDRVFARVLVPSPAAVRPASS